MTAPLPPGADPVLSRARPDVEWLVWQTVRPLGAVVSFAYSSTEGNPPGWLFTVSMQVDCRASSRQAASVLADAVRRAVCALPWSGWTGGVVNSVTVTEGPFWLPDPDGVPRYVVRFAVTAHPSRLAEGKRS